MGIVTMACGVKSYCAYHASIEPYESQELNIFEMHTILPDSEDDSVALGQPSGQDNLSLQPDDPVHLVTQDGPSLANIKDPGELKGAPTTDPSTFQPITHEIPDDPEPTTMDP